MSTLMRGASGRLLDGYRVAVEIGSFSVETDDGVFATGGWRLSGTIASRDEFYSDGEVFDLELDLLGGATHWCWSGVRAAVGERTVSVTGAGEPTIR